VKLKLTLLVLAVSILTGLSLTAFAPPKQEPTGFDNVALTGDLRVADDTTLLGSLILPQQSATVTGSFTIAPTASYIVLSSSLAVTSSATSAITTTGATSGQVIFVRNDNASDVIIIDGTGGTVECKADIALGFDDVQSFIYNGAVWNCLAGKADNS
jgi:hypothetical protein